MNVTLKDKTPLTITLRTWDGCNWSPDIAGDVLATWQPETHEDIKCWRMIAMTSMQG